MLRDRLLCLMVLVVSGNPAVAYFYTPAVIAVSAAILFAVALTRNISVTKRDLKILLVFMTIFSFHFISFGLQPLIPSASFMLKLAIALLAIRVIPNFDKCLVKVMFWLSIISLIFFAPVLLGVDVATIAEPFAIPFEQNNIQPMIHVGIHNYRVEISGVIRNSGMFWEPGAFAGYIIVAMLLLLRIRARYSKLYAGIMVIALLSTQSTTGYIALGIVLVGYLWCCGGRLSSPLRNASRFVSLVILSAGALVIYASLPFLKDKIVSQIVHTENEREYWEITRYGNAIFDLGYIIERPMFGWSLSDVTRDVDDEFILSAQGNGLTGAMVRLGMFGAVVYFVLIYQAFVQRLRERVLAVIAVICIATLLVGEQFILYPLFLVLMFAPRSSTELALPRRPQTYSS